MSKKPLDPSECPSKEGYTYIPDELMQELIKDSNITVAIRSYVLRYTAGEGKDWITITVPELSRALERPISEVRRGLKTVVSRGWVVREGLENGFRLSLGYLNPDRSSET